MRALRVLLGMVLCILGVVLTIIPGSSFLLLAGLVILSIDYKPARKCLLWVQKNMSKSAQKVDKYLYQRKYK